MRFNLVAVGSVVLVASCKAPHSVPNSASNSAPAAVARAAVPADPAFERTVLVRVVDEAGRAVAGAVVLAPRREADLTDVPGFLFAGVLGQVDRFGVASHTNDGGEVTVVAPLGDQHLVAAEANRWGTVRSSGDDDSVRIVLARDEIVRVRCTDPTGKPGVGAIVRVAAERDEDEEIVGPPLSWGVVVSAADGTVEVPHAQYWRALQREDQAVLLDGFVMWGDELNENRSIPFPGSGDGVVSIEVSPGGFVDVRADESTAGLVGDLRWMDAPQEPGDDYDIPEIPISFPKGVPFAMPLGLRFEIVVEVEERIDPRVAFDGPKKPGERVEVVIPRTRGRCDHGTALGRVQPPTQRSDV